MKAALIAALVAAVVAAGSAGASVFRPVGSPHNQREQNQRIVRLEREDVRNTKRILDLQYRVRHLEDPIPTR